MPAFIPPVHYCEIISYATVVARGGGTKNVQNVFHFRRTGVVLPVDAVQIETAFDAAIMSKVLLHLSVDYTQVKNTVRFFEDADASPVQVSRSGVGAIAGQRYETFTSSLLVLKTTQRGQSGQGKKFFGPLGESQINGDTLEAGAVTTLTAIGTALMAGFTDANTNIWVPGLKGGPRKYLPTAPQYRVNPTTTWWLDVVSFIPNKSLSTMRRRRIKTVT